MQEILRPIVCLPDGCLRVRIGATTLEANAVCSVQRVTVEPRAVGWSSPKS
jgi:hypothetical protein